MRGAVYNPDRDAYVSMDDFGMHLWELKGRGNASKSPATIKDLRYPQGSPNFVTALFYCTHTQLYFCACMDGHLRLYKHNLRIKSCLAWAESIVYNMAFVPRRDELVVGGAAGVKVRVSESRTCAFAALFSKLNLRRYFCIYA